MTKIWLDAGHGGKDCGAVGHADGKEVTEAEINLKICYHLSVILKSKGYAVRQTRGNDTYVGLTRRTTLANEWGADLFISIHCNGSANPKAEGNEVFHYPGSINGEKLADLIDIEMSGRLDDDKDRGVKSANFAVLRKTNMPAVLVETEFISNPKWAEKLQLGSHQVAIAGKIINGIQKYLDKDN